MHGIELNLVGAVATVAKLHRFRASVQKRILKSAISKSVTPLVKEVRAQLKASTNRRSGHRPIPIGKKVLSKSSHGITVIVGQKITPDRPTNLLQWISEGTKDRYRKDGASTGTVRPRSIMSHARNSAKAAVESRFESDLSAGVEREFKKEFG